MADFGDSRLPDRFWAKVSVHSSGCWLWVAAVSSSTGYAMFGLGGGRAAGVDTAHRVIYKALVGSIPRGLVIDHLCRVRHCVNPEHLEVVTYSVNLRRGDTGLEAAMHQWAKTHCPRGHEYDEENTYVYRRKNGTENRQCRACKRLWKLEGKLPDVGM